MVGSTSPSRLLPNWSRSNQAATIYRVSATFLHDQATTLSGGVTSADCVAASSGLVKSLRPARSP